MPNFSKMQIILYGFEILWIHNFGIFAERVRLNSLWGILIFKYKYVPNDILVQRSFPKTYWGLFSNGMPLKGISYTKY